LVGLCAGLSTGASVLISQRYGAHDDKGLHDAVHTAIAVTFILCVIVTVLGMMIVQPMLRLMSTPDDVMQDASAYLEIYFLGITGLLLYNMGSAILRAVGDSRRPLYYLCFSALTNIVFDLLFVVQFNLGVRGVAYATILSQFLSAVLVLYSLTHDHAAYGIQWRKLCIRKDVLRSIFSVGLPSGIQHGITSFSNVFVQSYINAFGSACMAGWSSYNKLDAFILIPVQSLALASTTFVGQNWGAGKLKRARTGVKQTLILSLVITVTLSVVTMILAQPLLRLFGSEEEMLAYGRKFIMIISPFYFTICFNQVYGGALRGIGDAKRPMVIMLSSFVVFRQLFLLVNRLLGNSFIGVSLAYPMGWVLCSTLLTICYRRSGLYKEKDKAETSVEQTV
jgi:putative MATE family efflux protein